MGENHDSKIRDILIMGIENAKDTIHLAVAYFSDLEIVDIIKRKAQDGVNVEVVIYDHSVNSPAIIELNFQNIKTHFYSVNYSQPIYPKFCVIDEEILFTGNHGWGYAANKAEHPEPMIINNERGLVEEYLNKFDAFKRCCGTSRLVHFRTKPELSVRY
jgi:phosphatidylserine/phosphatidylglycerophosphate/cardiolipin synthase-like enzyme